MDYYSAIKKNEIMPGAAPWMDLRISILSKVRKRKSNTMWYHLYGESKVHKSTCLQNKNRLTGRTDMCLSHGHGRGTDWEFRLSRCKLLHIVWINKVPLYHTGNRIQYPVTYHNGKEYIYIHTHITESLCRTEEINTTF